MSSLQERSEAGLLAMVKAAAISHLSPTAVRQRIPEIAILKTIGFTGHNIMGLVLVESALLLLLGAVLGLAFATVVVASMRLKLGPTVPALPVEGAIWLRGLGLSGLIGLGVGTIPALRGMRLRIADALSRR